MFRIFQVHKSFQSPSKHLINFICFAVLDIYNSFFAVLDIYNYIHRGSTSHD